MKKLIILFVITLSLSSCFDKADFKLIDSQVVKVDQLSLKGYEVDQKVWLIRSYSPHSSNWEILDDFDIGQIGFEPKKDTVFIFNSQVGNYRRRIALGVLVKKY
jgi:hypothetical protein